MPEGPTLVILKESAEQFKGKKIKEISGNSTIDQQRLLHKKVIEFDTWGKHFLVRFNGFFLRIHFLLFGKYLINDKKDSPPRLHLGFTNGEINFYASAIRIVEGDPAEVYDFSADVMRDEWDPKAALEKVKEKGNSLICDVLLDQEIFSGVGNIIKNEILFKLKVHPLSKVSNIPVAKLKALIREARDYSFQFYEWKKKDVLKKHWKAHRKKTCPRDHIPFEIHNAGKLKRKAYYCVQCQQKY